MEVGVIVGIIVILGVGVTVGVLGADFVGNGVREGVLVICGPFQLGLFTIAILLAIVFVKLDKVKVLVTVGVGVADAVADNDLDGVVVGALVKLGVGVVVGVFVIDTE